MTSSLVALLCLVQAQELSWPPKLSDGKSSGSATGAELLKPSAKLQEGVKIARTAPVVDFFYYPGQTHVAKLWSAWGDNFASGDSCWSAIGDHDAPEGHAFLYEFDAAKKELRQVLDVTKLLNLPKGHYTPGKIHSQLCLGSDGWLYFATHRGSTRVTTPKNHFTGDWILRYHPKTGKSEIVAHAPLPGQCMPTGVLDPERLLFYSGTQDGVNEKKPAFLAYDLKAKKVLYSGEGGPSRAMILAQSTGRVYFQSDILKPGENPLLCFDPKEPGRPRSTPATFGVRAATRETPNGVVYTADREGIFAFDTTTERAEKLGPSAVGSQDYITSIHADMKTGRYLYYVPGAHGGAAADGSPLVQFDVKTKTRKVICFLHPFCFEKFGYVPAGSYGLAVSPDGDKVYITWNGTRGAKKEDLGKKLKWNTCEFTVVHLPSAEREP